MARATLMATLELLEDHDIIPAPRERPRRREPHHPRANDRDLPQRAWFTASRSFEHQVTDCYEVRRVPRRRDRTADAAMQAIPSLRQAK